MRVSLQPAYVLHRRPHRDSSVLLDVLTAEYGRIGVIARGGRRQGRRGAHGALLQPFTPLFMSFSGRAELKTLTAVEAAGRTADLANERLYSSLYLNELLVRLLHRNDPHPGLFAAYGGALEGLAGRDDMDTVLRRFELVLLDELGYRVDFAVDGSNGETVENAAQYYYEPGSGLVQWRGGRSDAPTLYSGEHLLSLARGEFDGGARLAGRRLLREVLAVHLGGTPLRSRELFRAARGRGVRRAPRAGQGHEEDNA